MPPSPQPKHRGSNSAAAVAAAGGLQPLGAEDSSFSHSRSHSQSHFPPPLARTTGSGNSSSNHRVRKFVIGGGQPCPATPLPAVTPLGGGAAIPSLSSAHEADKENGRSSCTSTAAVLNSSSSGTLPLSAAPALGGGAGVDDVGGQKRKRSERVSVRLVPLDAATAERIRRAGYNPKLELSTPVRIGPLSFV